MRLAQEAKEGRLHELLEKTDAIIAELGTKARAACTFRLADLPEVTCCCTHRTVSSHQIVCDVTRRVVWHNVGARAASSSDWRSGRG